MVRHGRLRTPGRTVANASRIRGEFAGSIRHDAAAADVDAGGPERSVRLLGRSRDPDGGPGLELAPLADLVAHDWDMWPDDDLLLAVLVLHGDARAVDTADGLAHGAIRHGAVGRAVPRPVAVAGAAL